MPSRWWWFRRGLWPRALAYRTLRRESQGARTFNEKIVRKMAYDRNPLLVTFADKVAVRSYVADVVGPHLLTEAYAVAERAADVPWDRLPREYAAKVNHASGGVILVTESADPAHELPAPGSRSGFAWHTVHPDRADPERVADLLDHWLRLEFSWGPGGRPEWAYERVPRRILVEELLPFPERGTPPMDLKFFVFNGRCRVVRALGRTAAQGSWGWTADSHLTPDWEPIPVVIDPKDHKDTWTVPERPVRLAEMVRIAEALGAPVDFVRVDLYAIGERIVFGELTNYPSAATSVFEPAHVDRLWGDYWQQDY